MERPALASSNGPQKLGENQEFMQMIENENSEKINANLDVNQKRQNSITNMERQNSTTNIERQNQIANVERQNLGVNAKLPQASKVSNHIESSLNSLPNSIKQHNLNAKMERQNSLANLESLNLPSTPVINIRRMEPGRSSNVAPFMEITRPETLLENDKRFAATLLDNIRLVFGSF